MKRLLRILALLSALMLAQNLNAQQKWYVGGGVVGGFNFNNGSVGIVPEIGYRISPYLSAGMDIGYVYTKHSNYRMHRAIFDPYLRAHYTFGNFIYIMGEAFARCEFANVRPTDGTDPYNMNIIRAGFRPGIGIRMGGRSFLVARIGYLGYKNGSGEEDDGTFAYHCTSNDIYIGYAYNF